MPCSASRFSASAVGHGDQVVKLHHPAGAGLERLAVGAVHGAVADMLQLAPCRQCRPCCGGAEHLLEMAMLAVIHHIEDQVGIYSRTRSMMVARSVVP